MNLDGVVNDFAYQAVLRDQRLNDYLQRSHVSYLVQHEFPVSDSSLALDANVPVELSTYVSVGLRYRSQMFDTLSDAVEVRREDEVYRSRPHSRKSRTALVVWRLRPGP